MDKDVKKKKGCNNGCLLVILIPIIAFIALAIYFNDDVQANIKEDESIIAENIISIEDHLKPILKTINSYNPTDSTITFPSERPVTKDSLLYCTFWDIEKIIGITNDKPRRFEYPKITEYVDLIFKESHNSSVYSRKLTEEVLGYKYLFIIKSNEYVKPKILEETYETGFVLGEVFIVEFKTSEIVAYTTFEAQNSETISYGGGVEIKFAKIIPVNIGAEDLKEAVWNDFYKNSEKAINDTWDKLLE